MFHDEREYAAIIFNYRKFHSSQLFLLQVFEIFPSVRISLGEYFQINYQYSKNQEFLVWDTQVPIQVPKKVLFLQKEERTIKFSNIWHQSDWMKENSWARNYADERNHEISTFKEYLIKFGKRT